MSNKNCGPDVVKYFIVEPPKTVSITGSTTDFYVCSGTTFVNTISGCTGNVNLNDTIFGGDGSVLFSSTISACTGIYTSNLYGCSPITIHDDLRLKNKITEYNNQSGSGLVGKFLSGTTNGFVLADISDIQSIDVNDKYVTGGTNTSATINSNSASIGLLYNQDIIPGTYSLPYTDSFITGGTYSNGTLIFTNNSGNTFNVTGLYTGQTSYVNSLTTGVGLSANTTNGDITIINTDPDQLVTISGGTGIMTGGTYPNFTIENTLPDQTVVINNGSNINVSGTYPNFTIGTTGLTDNNRFITGFTYNNNTFTVSDNSGSTFNATINSVTGLTVNGNLTVTGNTNVRAVTGTTALFSGSGQNILTIIGSGNTTSQPLFSVQGSSGELFSVSDSLAGSLFGVNDISGLPIIEVFSDNTILMGDYQAPSLNTTKRLILSAGTNTVYSIPTNIYTGVFVDYTLISATGARSGNIMSIWSGVTTQYSETATNDIGSTSEVTFSVSVLGNNAVISSSATTSNWTLKTIIRSI